MRRTTLGNSGIEVSGIGLGCMGMSEFYGERDDDESIRAVHRALELGVNFLDTADVYGMGENERLLARALEGKRDQAVVATKFGLVRDGSGAWTGVRGDPAYVRESCDASLQRLGLDSIDLFYQHRADANVPIEETVGAMKELVEAGKVRALGLSEVGVDTLRKAHAIHPIAALQSEYSLWSRQLERDVIPACEEMGITFVAYSPLGRGMLTGTLGNLSQLPEGDYRRSTPRFQADHFEKNLVLVERLRTLAEEIGITPAQVAIAWIVTRSEWSPGIVPIPGSKRRRYVELNVEGAEFTLSRSDLVEIDNLFPIGAASGERYPEHRMSELGR